MHTGLRITFAGVVLAGTAVAVTALIPPPADNSLDATRIVDSLSRAQTETDKIPAPAMATLPKGGHITIDPSQTRLVGHSQSLTFYAAPAGDKICLIPVNSKGEGPYVGCTMLKDFESYGLKFETPDRKEAGWLVVPAGANKSLDSVKSDAGWSQAAPNFLVRNDH
jgi:hypothetical protein